MTLTPTNANVERTFDFEFTPQEGVDALAFLGVPMTAEEVHIVCTHECDGTQMIAVQFMREVPIAEARDISTLATAAQKNLPEENAFTKIDFKAYGNSDDETMGAIEIRAVFLRGDNALEEAASVRERMEFEAQLKGLLGGSGIEGLLGALFG